MQQTPDLSITDDLSPSKKPANSQAGGLWLHVAGVVTLSLIVGLPTLTGGFVGGDDHQLVLNHALVNHPSFSHAMQLFSIVHRDLYQPLPMVFFSFQFALADGLGLFESGEASAGAWLFHLFNVLMHATNAVLVLILLRRLGLGKHTHALAVASLFAIHPLQAETIAWLNGQMMLMSTLFALASLIALATFAREAHWKWAVLAILFTACCGLSKVRLGLPVLMLIVLFASAGTFRRVAMRTWLLWIGCTLINIGFVALNIWTTAQAELFSGGAEHFEGPRLARVVLSLAFYVQHFFWPVGLASWYPAPQTIEWTDHATLVALSILIPTLAWVTWASLRYKGFLLGVLWFGATIASTLPLFPARNILAADRYMYLPMIGMIVAVYLFAESLHGQVTKKRASSLSRAITGAMILVLAVLLIGLNVHTSSYYATPIAKMERITALFPHQPRVWGWLAWTHHHEGKEALAYGREEKARKHFEQAIELGKRELERTDAKGQSDGHQVIAMALWDMGQRKKAIDRMQIALLVDKQSPLLKFRLARMYAEIDRTDDAISLLEQAVESAPKYNPVVNALAKHYQKRGQTEKARELFHQALETNSYEVTALMGLSELDIAQATPQTLQNAIERLHSLLLWMPENLEARTNLGVALANLGRIEEAMREYEQIAESPYALPTALLNLAGLYEATGQVDSGRIPELLSQASTVGLDSFEQALFVQQMFLVRGMYDSNSQMWREQIDVLPNKNRTSAWHKFSGIVKHMAFHADGSYRRPGVPPIDAGDLCKQELPALISANRHLPIEMATLACCALIADDIDEALSWLDRLNTTGVAGAPAKQQLALACDLQASGHPQNLWPALLLAHILASDGLIEPAKELLSQFETRCQSSKCQALAETLKKQLDG